MDVKETPDYTLHFCAWWTELMMKGGDWNHNNTYLIHVCSCDVVYLQMALSDKWRLVD